MNAELTLPGYVIERKYRVCGQSVGVSMYIRDDLQFRRRSDLEVDGIEFLWVELFIPQSKPLLLCSAYRPPDSSKFLDKNFISSLKIYYAQLKTKKQLSAKISTLIKTSHETIQL